MKSKISDVGSQSHLQLRYWTMWAVVHFSPDFSPKTRIFRGVFSLQYTINIAGPGRISEASMGLRVNEPKKKGARS